MSNEIIQFKLPEMTQMAEAIAQSGLFGMKSWQQALALMLVAQSENQHPATITQDYDIIQGKATRKTHSVLARFQQMGGSVEWHELTDSIADATFSHQKGGRLRISWTIDQAKRAKLTGKDNWMNYPRAMLRARCIAEGVRAIYPAAIGGMMISEEAQDTTPTERIVEKDITGAGSHTTAQPQKPAALPQYTAEAMSLNIKTWGDLINSGKATADQLIARVSSKYTLTQEQIQTIKALEIPAQKATADENEPIDAEFVAAFDKGSAE